MGEGFEGEFEGLLAPLRNSGMPLSIADATAPDLPLIGINEAFSVLTGYGKDECLGRNCRFLQGPRTDRAAVARIRTALVAGLPVREVLLNQRRDGTPFLNELLVVPLHDAAGRLRVFAGMQRAVPTVQVKPIVQLEPTDGARIGDAIGIAWPRLERAGPGWLADADLAAMLALWPADGARLDGAVMKLACFGGRPGRAGAAPRRRGGQAERFGDGFFPSIGAQVAAMRLLEAVRQVS